MDVCGVFSSFCGGLLPSALPKEQSVCEAHESSSFRDIFLSAFAKKILLSMELCACRSQPSFGFGSGEREVFSRCYISELHSKTNSAACSSSPGISTSNPISSMGVQHTSRGKSSPSWGFGKANRFKPTFADNGTPGPGAYGF